MPLWTLAQRAPSKFLFIENKGQWPQEVLFRSDIPGGYVFVKKTGLEYFFYDTEVAHQVHAGISDDGHIRKSLSDIRTEVVSFDFINVYRPRPESLKRQKQAYNFFYGSDETEWVSDARAYEEVWLKDIYKGIDFRLYSLGEALKYEYLVHPKGNPSDIKLKYKGQEEISLSNGDLKFKTKVNAFREFAPFTYQNSGTNKIAISSQFLLEKESLSFEIEDYDTSLDLIIDPELVFSTYSGSTSDNWSHTATFDDTGNLYAGGTVFGPEFPVTDGSFQTLSDGTRNDVRNLNTDIVIMKYSPDGQELLYATFLGGSQSEVPHSLICNSKGELVIFGTTSSTNYPVTSTAFQRDFKAGKSLVSRAPITTGISFELGTDIFISVLSSDGSSLKGSTYMGGSENDGLHDFRNFEITNYGDEFRGEVYVGPEDDIYVASITESMDFPTTGTTESLKGIHDAVVFQLNSSVSKLIWSTYLGGGSYDAGYGIRVTDSREVFILGTTKSKDLDTTPLAYERELLGGSDAFIAKYKNGIKQSLTYMGTDEDDIGSLLDLDEAGNVYVFGLTLGDYPIKGSVYQNPRSGQFIHSLNSNLSETRFSTVFGSSRAVGMVDLVPTAFLVNSCGNIYVAGWGGRVNQNRGYNRYSTTSGLPVSADAYKPETSGSNFYFAIFEAEARSFLYGTYFGSQAPTDPDEERGDHLDGGTCRFDKNGIIYHSACVCRSGSFIGFPTLNSFESNHNSSNCNMAAFKFDIDALDADFDILANEKVNPEVVCVGTDISLKNKSKGGRTYQWTLEGDILSRLTDLDFAFDSAGDYTLKLEAYNSNTCAKSDSTFRKIRVIPFEVTTNPDTAVCSGDEVLLSAKGGLSYRWSPAELLDNSNVENPIAQVFETTVFKVIISNNACSVSKNVEVRVVNDKADFSVSENLESCVGRVLTLNAAGSADYFLWTGPDIDSIRAPFIEVRPEESSTYTVRAFYKDGCKPFKEIGVHIDKSFTPDFTYSIEYFCAKPYTLIFENSTVGSPSFTWFLEGEDSVMSRIPENYRYNSFGEYVVSLKATNDIGCVLFTEKKIEIPDADGIIPNAISPNGDGKNDTFVVGLPSPEIGIYDRWGKLIYENKSYDNSWGKDIDSDTYFYELRLDGGEKCKGWIEVFK